MKTKLFFIILLIALCITSASAVTVTNSRYRGSISAGGQDSFFMVLKSDTPAEIGIPLVVSMDSGNCSEWVTPDTKSIKLTSEGVPVTAKISVPVDSYNGNYLCRVSYMAPAQGMIQSELQVPFSITVKGGKDAPEPVITTPITTIQTPTVTIQAKVPVQIPFVAQVAPKEPTAEIPIVWLMGGFMIVYIIGGILGAAFIVVLIVDYRRGKK
jgi:hypothetical protein